MFPKTTYPDEMRALLLTASEGNALPLWQAVPLTSALAALPAGTLRDYFPLPQPPEEQLRRTASSEETGAVYRLCALLVRLLSGKEMPERTEALFRLLDRGLRLEPTRRFPDRDALLSALREAEEEVNARVRPGLCLRGTAGVFAGKTLSLAPPLTLGRQPDLCQLIFPPDTRGVSRRHCRVELVWGTVLITDLHSRYGTAAGGSDLSPGCPSPLLPGQSLALAGGAQAFVLVRE